jgi:hypothetical protein
MANASPMRMAANRGLSRMTASLQQATSAIQIRRQRAINWLGVVLALVAVLPVVVARYPQMSDYPAHLARYYVMLDGGRSVDLAQFYGFDWRWTGNVGVDLLIGPFAHVFGLELGGRVIVGLIALLTSFGVLAVDYALRGRVTLGGLLALTFVWSPMLLIGLVNYAGGQALALWGFALWVWLDGRGQRGLARAALFVPVGLVVWVFHLSAWALLGVLVFGYEWHRLRRTASWWQAFAQSLPLAAPLAVMMALPGTTSAFSYGQFWWVYKQAIWLKAMRDTVYELDFLSLVLVMVAVGLAVHLRRLDGRLGWAALALLVLTIVVPRHISGGDYADYRLVTAGLMVACLAIDWPHAPRFATLGAPALYLLRLAVTTASWQADSLDTAEILQGLDHIPRGAKVASAVLVPRENWRLDHFEHIGAYAVWRNHALVNANFAVPNVHMLRLKQAAPGFVDPSHRILQSISLPVDLTAFGPAKQAEWLWYVGPKAPSQLPPGAVVVWRSRLSLVAHLPPAQPPLAKSGESH